MALYAKYAVGTPGSGERFTSIQAAIDQAVADGHTTVANGAWIVIKPGDYTEDVSIPNAGIQVLGEPSARDLSVNVVGEFTVDLSAGASRDVNRCSIVGLAIFPGVGQAGIRFTGANAQKLFVTHCTLEGSGTPMLMDNTGVDGGGFRSQVVARDVQHVSATTAPCIDRQVGEYDGEDIRCRQADPDDAAVAIAGAGFFTVSRLTTFGRLTNVGSGAVTLMLFFIEAALATAIAHSGGGLMTLGKGTVVSDFDPMVTGAGAFAYNQVVALGAGGGAPPPTTFGATLNAGAGPDPGAQAIEAALNQRYRTAVPAKWALPIPLNVRDALDRLISGEGGASIVSFGSNAVGSSTTTRYLDPWVDDALAPTTPIQWRAPLPGTFDRMFLRQNDINASNGNDIVYTFRKNNVVTGLTVTISSLTIDGSDLANSFVVAQGDLLDVEVTKAAGIGPSPNDIVSTVRFRPS